LGPDQNMKDESAKKLAEKDGMEKKPKVVSSNSPSSFGVGEGVDGVIYATTSLADGSVVVGGNFDTVNGQPRQNLACFKPDGSLDTTMFAGADAGVDGTVYALAIDAKGNVLVGGYFSVNTGQGDPLQNFVRFAGGKLDPAFTAGLSPNGAVYAITVQPKGQIVVGGEFTQAGAQLRRNLIRFKPDGTLDGPIASADASTGAVRSLVSLSNGGVLAGGSLEIAGQTARNILIAP
ncbi:MAG: delta-60 repeat domain-containing protein, partial [Chthoniobacterales bacterium]